MSRILKFLLSLSLFVCGAAQAQLYVLGQAGIARYNQETAASHKVYPQGIAYSGGIGMRKKFLEFETFFMKFNGESDIKHDGQSNTLVHEQSSLIVASNFYFNSLIYGRLGYGFHRVHQSFKTPMSSASQAGAEKAYAIKDDGITDGIIFGGGLSIIDTKNIGIYTQFENMSMSTLKASVWNLSLGFRFYFD